MAGRVGPVGPTPLVMVVTVLPGGAAAGLWVTVVRVGLVGLAASRVVPAGPVVAPRCGVRALRVGLVGRPVRVMVLAGRVGPVVMPPWWVPVVRVGPAAAALTVMVVLVGLRGAAAGWSAVAGPAGPAGLVARAVGLAGPAATLRWWVGAGSAGLVGPLAVAAVRAGPAGPRAGPGCWGPAGSVGPVGAAPAVMVVMVGPGAAVGGLSVTAGLVGSAATVVTAPGTALSAVILWCLV